MISVSTFTNWAEQFINFERTPQKNILNLEKMEFISEIFGSPHLAYKTIHVAGSKGKGSVSTLVSSSLVQAGFKTGLYTSPHVVDFRERITLGGKFFSDKEYSAGFFEVMQGIERLLVERPDFAPTWFEVVTVLSFVLFRNAKVDYGVFEVGMGGRLDTTNIIKPVACAIMPIELEHCQYLGDTLEKVAGEKAGIIKPNTPVFCFRQKAEALSVFEKTCAEKAAPLFYLPDFVEKLSSEISLDGHKIEISYKRDTKIGALFEAALQANLKLLNQVQAENASLAAALVKYCEPNTSLAQIEAGLSEASLFGRFEIIKTSPLVIIDGAHTEASLSLAVKSFQKLCGSQGILVFACAEDKPAERLPYIFEKNFDTIYLTIPGSFKKSNFEKLTKDFEEYFKRQGSPPAIISSKDYRETILRAVETATNQAKPVLITGSFYLAGEAKAVLEK